MGLFKRSSKEVPSNFFGGGGPSIRPVVQERATWTDPMKTRSVPRAEAQGWEVGGRAAPERSAACEPPVPAPNTPCKAFPEGQGVQGFSLGSDVEFWSLFKKIRRIGRGTFGKVLEVEYMETGERFAAKVLDKDSGQGDFNDLVREVRHLSVLDHPNIIKLFAAYEAPNRLFLVTELATGGELMDHLGKDKKTVYSEHFVRHHIITVLKAIEHMHSMHIAHRDLKPENLLLSDATDEAVIKIVDLGLSRTFSSSSRGVMKTICGTHRYLAPELIECEQGTARGYDKAVDMWGVGLITYIMLFGKNPFQRESHARTHVAILECDLQFPSVNVSDEAKDFIRALVCRKAAQRLTAAQALKTSRWLQMHELSEEGVSEQSQPLVVQGDGHGDGSGPRRSIQHKLWEWNAERLTNKTVKSAHRRLAAGAAGNIPSPDEGQQAAISARFDVGAHHTEALTGGDTKAASPSGFRRRERRMSI